MSLTEESELQPPPLSPVKKQQKMVVDASHVIHNRLVLAMYSLYLNGNIPTTGGDSEMVLTSRTRDMYTLTVES